MTVALFITCLTDAFFPRVGEAVVRVLRHFGCRVEFPAEQTCCGQPAYNSGFHSEAAGVARRMLSVFEPYAHVVTPSASCAAMVANFSTLLADDAAAATRARELAARTHEFSQFLRQVLHVDAAPLLRVRDALTFHFPCHAREASSPGELERLLAPGCAGLRAPERPDLCCGFGGLFAGEFPEVSGGLLGDKLDQLTATGARLVVCNEGGCALQMAGGAQRRNLPLRFVHVAELLAESLGLMEPRA